MPLGPCQKIPGNALPHMPIWSKYKDPPTFMICGINFLKMLIIEDKRV